MYNFFMNIRTLSKEKLDYKTGSLPVALYPEKMIKRKDKESGYYGRIMSRGKFNIVKGQNIKILGNDDSVGLYFVPEDAQGEVVKLSENMIISNKTSELYCIIPEELKADTRYKINIVTKYSRNGKERKEAISCMNDCLLTVK